MNAQILKLSSKIIVGDITTTNTFTLDLESGLYKRDNEETANFGLSDILTKEAPRTIEIISCKLGDKTFSLNQNVALPNNQNIQLGTITKFYFEKNRCKAKIRKPNDTIVDYDLSNLVNYVGTVEVITTDPNERLGLYTNFDTVERRIVGTRALLKLQDYVHTQQSFYSFVKNLILDYNLRYNTVYAETNRAQETRGRRRSMGDMFMICKYYYPTCNLYDLIKILYNQIVPDTATTRNPIGSLVCNTINKRVWWPSGNTRFDHETKLDEYGYTTRDYCNTLAQTPITRTVDVAIDETIEERNATQTDLERIKTLFVRGTRFKTRLTPDKTITMTSNDFYDGAAGIYYITDDGKRKLVFNKRTREQARIL